MKKENSLKPLLPPAGQRSCKGLPMPRVLPAILAGLAAAPVSSGLAQTVAPPSAASDGPVLVIPEVEVTGERYNALTATSGTKVDTPLLDTPVSVQVIPKEVLEDRQVLSLQEAVKNVSGTQTPPNNFFSNFLIRGFNAANATFRNALQLENITGAEDLAFIDHIEIVKGPSAMLYGRIQPGGLVDVITKKPLDQPFYSLQQEGGSWGQIRSVADATGPVTSDGSLLYRVIGVYDKADDFVKFDHHENKAIAGDLTWRPSASFEANLQLEQYWDRMTNPGFYRQQVPVVGNRPLNLPIDWTQNDPLMWSRFPDTINRTLIAFDWTYALNEEWKVRQRFHYSTEDERQVFLINSSFNPNTGLLARRISDNPTNNDIYAMNLDVLGDFTTGPLSHKTLYGVDWYRTDQVQYGYQISSGQITPGVPLLNVFSPTYGNIDVSRVQAAIGAQLPKLFFRNSHEDTGFYVQDQIRFLENWELLLGGRYDIAQFATSSGTAPFVARPVERQFSPRGGLLYKLSPEVSVYTSYSESLSSLGFPSLGSSGFLPPQKGVQYEVGAKASLMGGKITASAALFDLYFEDLPLLVSTKPLLFSPVAEVESKGFEFDIAGQVTENVSLIGSYTYDYAAVSQGGALIPGVGNVPTGNRWPGVPLHSANLWAKYDTAPGRAEGWSFGAGIYVNGTRQGNVTNTWQLEGYNRVDAMLAYRTQVAGTAVTTQVNLQNIFDTKYFEGSDASLGLGGGTAAYYGLPRTVLASVKVGF